MRKISIAVAPNRVTKVWANKTMQWSELVERCSGSNFTVTSETVSEYARMSREQQSNVKDVGGFVGGYLTEGKRNKNSVKFRDVVSLDIDNGKAGVWEKVLNVLDGTACFVYSTHKHTAAIPRLRLVILLDRSVSPDEYKAISRAVASEIGLEFFDPTTYAPERLMYWPSRSKDGDEFFRVIEGAPLNADDKLATYVDWRDTSNWEESTWEDSWRSRESKKQGDPCEKQGIVGLFCRTYDIPSVIEQYLSDVYDPAGENRYTYKQGSVSAGLVLYEDGKFAYSHNATDPCSQHLVNAFDIVRLHKFAEQDADCASETPIHKRPSFRAMEDLAVQDPAVKKRLAQERQLSAENDFSDVKAADGDKGDWTAKMKMSKKGGYQNICDNILVVLDESPQFKDSLWFNEFKGTVCVNRPLPWRDFGPGEEVSEWTNADDSRLRCYLQVQYGLHGRENVYDALVEVTQKNKKHPVREYLNSLTWDGVPRLETLFIDFLGARDTKVNRAFTRKHMIAAVARILKRFKGDSKYDQILTLVGKEGIGKSTLLQKLAKKGWFSDSIYSLEGKDGMEVLQGAWLVEVAELVGVKKSENEVVKSFLSRERDTFRPAYGRRVESRDRECVFFATTNEKSFLKGDTGNRRYWVIETGVHDPAPRCVFTEFDEAYRDQIWAEAKTYYERGESRLIDEEELREARALQEAYNEHSADDRIGIIKEFLEKRLPADWKTRSVARRQAYFRDTDPLDAEGVIRRDVVSNVEIYVECFGMGLNRKNLKYETREISSLMARVEGWEKGGTASLGGEYGKQRIYKRIITDTTEDDDI